MRICIFVVMFFVFAALLVSASKRMEIPTSLLKKVKKTPKKRNKPKYDSGVLMQKGAPVITQDNFWVLVGTNPLMNDVISMDQINNNTAKTFSTDNVDMNEAAIYGEKTDSVNFFLGSVSKIHRGSLRIERPFVESADQTIVSASITNFADVTKPVPFVLVNDPLQQEPLPLNIQLRCLASGTTIIKIFLRIIFAQKQADGSLADQQKIISFGFYKVCNPVSPQPAPSDDKMKYGFMIGSTDGGNEIAINGVARWNYRVNNINDEDDGRIPLIPATSYAFVYYYVSFYQTFSLGKPTVYVHKPDVLSVNLSGPMAAATTQLLPNVTQALSATFNCMKDGISMITIASPFADGSYTAYFTIRKNCTMAVSQDVEGTGVLGLMIGTQRGQNDIISNGLTKEFYRHSFSKEDEDKKKWPTILPSDNSVTVWLEMAADNIQEYEMPLVTASSINLTYPIMKPVIKGGVTLSNRIDNVRPLDLTIEFQCFKAGTAIVNVDIPLKPAGRVVFSFRKRCKEDNTVVPITDNNDPTIFPTPGLQISTSRSLPSDAMLNGVPQPPFHWTTDKAFLYAVGEDKPDFTFYLSITDDTKLNLGTAQALVTYNIMNINLVGPASGPGVMVKGSNLALTVNFKCSRAGQTTIALLIPISNADNTDTVVHKLTFVKKCADPGTYMVKSGRGGIGIRGLSVGSAPFASDIVFQGYPTKSYFNQRHKVNPDWGKIMVPSANLTASFFISYRSDVAFTAAGVEVMSDDNDSSTADSSENGVSIDAVGGTSTPDDIGTADKKGVVAEGDYVDFETPVAIQHGHLMRASLSGSAVAGGRLIRNGEPLTLDITFNCQYAGTGSITIELPMLPHGVVTFTVPKTCDGFKQPTGTFVADIAIGTTQDGTDVIENGMTKYEYTPYKVGGRDNPKKRNLVPPGEESTTFYIHGRDKWWENPIKVLEPIVYSHRPLLNPELKHDWSHIADSKVSNITSKEESAVDVSKIPLAGVELPDGKPKLTERDWDSSVELILARGLQTITITYNCMWKGETAVTVIIPLLPKGKISWTFTKRCLMGLWDEDDNNVDDSDIKTDSSLDEDSDYDPNNPDKDIDDDRPDTNWNTWDETRWNSDDDANDDDFTLHRESTGYLNVGTSSTGGIDSGAGDVISSGIVDDKYSLPVASHEDLTTGDHRVVHNGVEFSNFYLSLNTGKQKFGIPTARSKRSKDGNVLSIPILTGPASKGGTISSDDKPMLLQLQYKCKPGVAGVHPILISIPYSPASLGSVSFRVIKICGTFQNHTDWQWTSSRALSLIAGIVIIVVGLYLYRQYEGKSGGYARVALSEMEMDVENQLDNAEDMHDEITRSATKNGRDNGTVIVEEATDTTKDGHTRSHKSEKKKNKKSKRY